MVSTHEDGAMFLNEVLAQLESEGFAATPHRIHHAVRTGRLKPRPRKNGLGARIYTRSHLRQLRAYMVNTRRGPRPHFPREPLDPVGYLDSEIRTKRAKALDRQISRLRATLIDD